MTGGRGTDLFVGRERELRLLAGHVRAAADGQAALVLVTGEQGAGKTRLVAQACEVARDEAALVVEASCWDEPGAPAYTPWVQVVEALRRHYGDDLLSRLSPLERSALAPLTLEAPDEARPVDASHAQFLLHRAVSALLRAAAARTLLVLAIDDVHAADAASLRLLREVLTQVRDIPLLVLATVRDDALDEDGHLERVRRAAEVLAVGGLERAAVDDYVAARLPDAQPPLRTWLWQTSDGNPLFLRELVRLADAGRPGSLPETVAAAVRRRLSGLGPVTQQIVQMAAVLGRVVPLRALGLALALQPEQLLERLDEAMRHGVLVSDGSPSQVRFAHGLFREVVLSDLGLSARALHARAAEVLEQLSGDDPDALALIAEQHYRSLPVGLPELARTWCIRAAERALERLNFDAAAALLAQALEAHALSGDGARERGRLLARLADAEFRAGRPAAAREAWLSAAALARAGGDAAALAEAALGVAREAEWGRFNPERAALLEEALTGRVDDATRVQLQARLAAELYWTPERERRQRLSDEALALARDVGDPAALAAALRGRLWAFRDPDTVDVRIRESEELLSVAAGDPETVEEGRYHRILALLERGRVPEAFAEIDAHERLADALQHPVYRWRSQMWQAMRLQVAGRLDEARAAAERARRTGEEAAEPNTALIFVGQQAENERWVGWSAATQQRLPEQADRYPAIPLLRCAVTAVLSDTRPADSRRMLDALVEQDLPFDSSWLGSHVWLADACEVLGAAEQAAALLPRLRPYADLWLVSGGGAACQGPVVSLLGALELTAGDPEAAVPLLTRGRAVSEGVGAPAWAAADGVRLGVALRLLGQPDEGVLDASLEQARRLGLSRLLRRPMPDSAPAEGHRGPGGVLTPREQDVLALLAQGRSNREIAAALFVTEKTVKTHVSAVLGKLQCTDRTQAALYAVRHGVGG